MQIQDTGSKTRNFSVLAPAAHALHESAGAEDFSGRFEAFTGQSVGFVVGRIVRPDAPRAVFLTGSIPLGMGTHGSDVDLLVLIDDKRALVGGGSAIANTDQELAFSNDSDSLRAGLFLKVLNGVTVEVAAVVTPGIARIQRRLRSRGPELTEGEIMTLGRLGTGWLLLQTDDYLQRAGILLQDPAFDVYCSTRNFTYGLIYRLKAGRALELGDIPQALHLGRLSVEMACLAFFASEGLSYLGAKWLAQIGHARGGAERLARHPLLADAVTLLFPVYGPGAAGATSYLLAVTQFLDSMRSQIEQKTLFRIAFRACPQIHPSRATG